MSPRYLALVRSFPVFAYAPEAIWGLEGVDLRAIDAWAQSVDPDGSDGVRDAAAFVLNLWSSYEKWSVGAFDMFHAFKVWDAGQIRAFQAWAADPWRP